MKRAIPIVLMILLIGSTAHAGWLDRFCERYPNSRYCAPTDPPQDLEDPPLPPSTSNDILTEVEAVPYLTDKTATYVFNSKVAGTIVYGGAAGNADKAQAVVGNNTITWTLADGTYGNCTVRVGNSNMLTVPTFKVTSKYPIVFVHGWYGNASAWNTARAYLTSQGWDSSLLIARSITSSNTTLCQAAQAAEVAEWVEDALDQFPGFEKIDLVGHSRGGGNIMRALWHGYIDPGKVRHVVTLAGANRICGSDYPAIPADETPGSIKFSAYYSDGSPDADTLVNYSTTYIKGAYHSNLHPLTHADFIRHSNALQLLNSSLMGQIGSN